jgi:hypothetical protein
MTGAPTLAFMCALEREARIQTHLAANVRRLSFAAP